MYIYIYTKYFSGFPHVGYYRILSRVSGAIQ